MSLVAWLTHRLTWTHFVLGKVQGFTRFKLVSSPITADFLPPCRWSVAIAQRLLRLPLHFCSIYCVQEHLHWRFSRICVIIDQEGHSQHYQLRSQSHQDCRLVAATPQFIALCSPILHFGWEERPVSVHPRQALERQRFPRFISFAASEATIFFSSPPTYSPSSNKQNNLIAFPQTISKKDLWGRVYIIDEKVLRLVEFVINIEGEMSL